MLLYSVSTNGYFFIPDDDEDDKSKSWGEVELRWVKYITHTHNAEQDISGEDVRRKVFLCCRIVCSCLDSHSTVMFLYIQYKCFTLEYVGQLCLPLFIVLNKLLTWWLFLGITGMFWTQLTDGKGIQGFSVSTLFPLFFISFCIESCRWKRLYALLAHIRHY